MLPGPIHRCRIGLAGLAAILLLVVIGMADEPAAPPKAYLDGTGNGWKALGQDDFVTVNGNSDTWTWKDGTVHCTGLPVGVARTRKPLENFELVAQWRHLRSGGNSGIFVWAGEKSLEGLKPGSLPRGGIEVQILDHGYKDQYEKQSGKKADWFTTNGDVFPVGTSRMTPFPPSHPTAVAASPGKTSARVSAGGTTTTSAASMARCGSGSTVRKS